MSRQSGVEEEARPVKALVVIASRHGGTFEIGEVITRVFGASGIDADLAAMDDVASLEGYDAVVLGSAVYMGRWLESARAFVDRQRHALVARPVWMFSSGPLGNPPRPDESHAVDIEPLIAAVRPRGYRLFGGRLDRRELGVGEKLIAGAVRVQSGDFRDWDAIVAWAREIARSVGVSVHAPVPTG